MRIIVALLLANLPLQLSAGEAPTQLDWTGFKGNVYQTGNIIIAGQPLSEASMAQLADHGVNVIVNLKTASEISDTEVSPIDESAIAGALGIPYHHLPSGGKEHPYESDTVAQFAEIADNSNGTVLLHCRSGRRATHLWVAYLINHQGMDINQAIALGKQANFGAQPFEGYLDNEFEYRQTAP